MIDFENEEAARAFSFSLFTLVLLVVVVVFGGFPERKSGYCDEKDQIDHIKSSDGQRVYTFCRKNKRNNL